MQQKEITRVSIESIKKTRLEKLQPWLQLLVAVLAVAVPSSFAYWSVKTTQRLTRQNMETTAHLAQQNIEQQKISWSLTLLAQLTSNNPGLQKFAASTFAALYTKGTVPDYLLPALQEAAGDPKTNPDAARILRDLLASKRYPSRIQLGTNIFDCLFPISLDNKRFVRIGEENGRYFISVIVSEDNLVDFEIVDNVPRVNSFSHVAATQSGTLVVSSPRTGHLIYKVNVGSEITLSYSNHTVKVAGDRIMVDGSTLTRNQFQTGVGIILFEHAGFGLGGSETTIPKNVLDLYKKALDQSTGRP